MTRAATRKSLRVSLGATLIGLGCGVGGCGWNAACRAPSVPDVYPLGAVNRAHYQTMQANGEAANFILHLNDFVGSTSELTPAGKDHVLEIAARARSVPFPVVIERSENNASPALDEHRRASIAQVLVDLGVVDAPQRTVVAPAYGKGLTGREAEADTALLRQ
jgi:hypothetical protein